jgi:hypothetical protein
MQHCRSLNLLLENHLGRGDGTPNQWPRHNGSRQRDGAGNRHIYGKYLVDLLARQIQTPLAMRRQ